jgi:hypothetical protein
MLIIFDDFCKFSAKKLAFFSKSNVMIKNLHNLALFRVKNANFFAIFFGENIFKKSYLRFSDPPSTPEIEGDLDPYHRIGDKVNIR